MARVPVISAVRSPGRSSPFRSLAGSLGQARAPCRSLDLTNQRFSSLLGLGGEALQRFDLPPLHHDRLENLLVMLQEVVQAGIGDRLSVTLEAGNSRAGHLELAHLPLDRRDHQRRRDLECRRREISVEEEVEVLVGGDATDQLVAGFSGRMTGSSSRNALPVLREHARRQFLQGDVHEAVDC